MRSFRDRPIKQKLVILTMATTTAALVLAGLGNVVADSLLFNRYLRHDLMVLSRVITDNSTAALAFNDPDAAAQTLSALRERPHIVSACMYMDSDQGARLFAKYAPVGNVNCPQVQEREGGAGKRRELSLTQPVMLDGRRLGALVLYYDQGELTDRIQLYSSIVFGVFLLSALIAFLLSASLRDVITTSIAGLVRATTIVWETGDYGVRVERVSGDELGVLVDRFNEMLASIQYAFSEVEKERARFLFMAESMPQKIFTARADGTTDYLNPQWMEFTGLSLQEIENGRWTSFVHPDDLEVSLREWKRSLESGEPFQVQQRFRRADGKFRWHLSRAKPMRDAAGKVTMWIGSITEIHEQKEKEEELRRANEDLQQFAYSASHDLQEQIRMVTIYSEMVLRRCGDLLDAEGREYLGFLREGGQRLARLVADLLAYTHASTAELSQNPVSASAALNETLNTLAETIRDSGAVITVDDLPEVHMGAVHLQQVFQNLVGNAIKYRGEAAPAIHVSVRLVGDAWCFSVRDNGIGIDPQYKEKIFGVFKRLSHDRKYGGTGIGLAICQRIVERYGGRIWVESQVGNGATFFFTVPRQTVSSGVL